MSLPFRCTRKNLIRVCSALMCAIGIALALPNTASAWHGGYWAPRHAHWYRHGGWGPRFVVPPSFGVSVYSPGYYPAPVYGVPYYAAPPPYVPVPPLPTLSFGINLGFGH
jgi:hypothetical protein